eukprot:CAMPEP_0177649976 /NCGR_PEP_ID=MMETSP0447-20121125/11683_1 /TAXON_ID=0 /ORGANISM="Stygamoeba regulata, Strain BSH-02190019" /LENGTH=157 /DNA_ID=CAMNT_0019152789 /DNA_START=128 /DNA_END=601 /DNA_ORIENTATION=+
MAQCFHPTGATEMEKILQTLNMSEAEKIEIIKTICQVELIYDPETLTAIEESDWESMFGPNAGRVKAEVMAAIARYHNPKGSVQDTPVGDPQPFSKFSSEYVADEAFDLYYQQQPAAAAAARGLFSGCSFKFQKITTQVVSSPRVTKPMLILVTPDC